MFSLIPWKKKEQNEISNLRREMDDLVDRFMGRGLFPGAEPFADQAWYPTIDISENKKNINIRAEIPGADPKDIDVTLDGRVLTIKGEKKQEKEEKSENFYHAERSYGYFSRSVELPAEVDEKKIDATYKKGVLKIVLAKGKESESKKIEIKTKA